MIFWQVINSAVNFWIPGFSAYLPPILELNGAIAHTPACGGILLNACVGFSVNEMTQRFDPMFGSILIFYALCLKIIEFYIDRYCEPMIKFALSDYF